MPQDITTQWNSTFDLLEYALNHGKAIEMVIQCKQLGLRKYELGDEEWKLVEQLHDVLKASRMLISCKHKQTVPIPTSP
jgi:hypothetical protein